MPVTVDTPKGAHRSSKASECTLRDSDSLTDGELMRYVFHDAHTIPHYTPTRQALINQKNTQGRIPEDAPLCGPPTYTAKGLFIVK